MKQQGIRLVKILHVLLIVKHVILMEAVLAVIQTFIIDTLVEKDVSLFLDTMRPILLLQGPALTTVSVALHLLTAHNVNQDIL